MRRAARRVALGGGLLVILYFLAATLGAIIPGRTSPDNGRATVDVGLIRGPIHYDFLIPLTPDVRQRLRALSDAGLALDQPQARWLLIGWGAREFYTTTGTYSDVSAMAILKGLTGDGSVIRADVLEPLRPDAELPWIVMTPAQFDRFLIAIEASFARSDQGALRPLEVPGFSATDRFFEARGRFNLFQTCNVWVGQMLRAADIRFGLWVPLPYSVTLSRWLFQSSAP